MSPTLATRKWLAIGLPVLLAVLTLALFWPATGYDYVNLDDVQYISGNPRVLTGLTAPNVRWAFTAVYEDWWLPLLWLSYMVDVEWFGPGPFGFHLTNVVLHGANVALLFWFLFRATGSRWRSFFVAAFFAIHPLRVESVAWITARKDVLSGLFFFLSLLAYLRHAERPSAARFGLLAIAMLLGLMSKAILIVLPFLLLLLDYWPLCRAGDPWGRGAWTAWRPLLIDKLPLFCMSAAFILINLHTHVSGSGALARIPIWTRLGLVAPNFWSYLGKVFWPATLSIIYPEHDVVRWPVSLLAAFGLFAITLLLLRWRKQAPYALVGWLWFLLALFPVIRGVRLGLAAYADRFAYLPSIGLAMALVWAAAALAEKRPTAKIPLLALGMLLLAACAVRTALRLPAWKNSETMFTLLIRFAPDHPNANNSYGKVLAMQGRREEALPYFVRGTELGDQLAPGNYADTLIRLGRDGEAIAWLEQALAKLDPRHSDMNALLGLALLNSDRAAEAIPCFQRALIKTTRPLGLRIALLRAWYEVNNPVAAQEEIQRLREYGYPLIRDFESLAAHYATLWQKESAREAWLFFQNNLRRRPDDVVLLNNAAWILATSAQPPAPVEEALRLARRAAELAAPPSAGILDTLAAALAANGQFEEARQTAQQALDLARETGDGATSAQIAAHLAAYQRDKPWRETP